MSKTFILIATRGEGALVAHHAGAGETWSAMVDLDIDNYPMWIWEYPSGKMYRLKSYANNLNATFTPQGDELENQDWDTLAEYMGSDKEKVSDAYRKLLTEDEIIIYNFPAKGL